MGMAAHRSLEVMHINNSMAVIMRGQYCDMEQINVITAIG